MQHSSAMMKLCFYIAATVQHWQPKARTTLTIAKPAAAMQRCNKHVDKHCAGFALFLVIAQLRLTFVLANSRCLVDLLCSFASFVTAYSASCMRSGLQRCWQTGNCAHRKRSGSKRTWLQRWATAMQTAHQPISPSQQRAYS